MIIYSPLNKVDIRKFWHSRNIGKSPIRESRSTRTTKKIVRESR